MRGQVKPSETDPRCGFVVNGRLSLSLWDYEMNEGEVTRDGAGGFTCWDMWCLGVRCGYVWVLVCLGFGDGRAESCELVNIIFTFSAV